VTGRLEIDEENILDYINYLKIIETENIVSLAY